MGRFMGPHCPRKCVNTVCSFPVKDRLLQEVITGHTDGPVSGLEVFLGWQEVEAQLADVGLSCRRLSEWLRAATSPGDLDLAGDCTDPLIAAL